MTRHEISYLAVVAAEAVTSSSLPLHPALAARGSFSVSQDTGGLSAWGEKKEKRKRLKAKA